MSGSRRSNNQTLRGMNINADLLKKIGKKMGTDPLTGMPELDDMTRFFMSNLDDPDVQKLLEIGEKDLQERDKNAPNLDQVNFSTLPIEGHTVWLIDMQFAGLRTPEGQHVYDDDPVQVKEHARQCFQLHCWIKCGPGMHEDLFRSMEEYIGMPPTSKQVEKFIKSSMANPYPMFKPCLPQLLILSKNLGHHKAALKPFLDSLPAPFIWKVTPGALDNMAKDALYEEGKYRFRQYMMLAKEKKEAGNKAYAAKNGAGAVASYEDAIKYLDKAFRRFAPENDAVKEEAKKLKVICHANCSAARILGGRVSTEQAEQAIEDAEEALRLDVFYVKGYMRLARAYEALDKKSDAEEAIARALRLKDMENDKGLVDHLISIQTSGKGLPGPEVQTVKEWMLEALSGKSDRAERMKLVGGLWRKRCEDHLKKLQISLSRN